MFSGKSGKYAINGHSDKAKKYGKWGELAYLFVIN
jgi:hypothetical protein